GCRVLRPEGEGRGASAVECDVGRTGGRWTRLSRRTADGRWAVVATLGAHARGRARSRRWLAGAQRRRRRAAASLTAASIVEEGGQTRAFLDGAPHRREVGDGPAHGEPLLQAPAGKPMHVAVDDAH